MRRLAWLLVIATAAWDPVTSKVREVEEGNHHYEAGEFKLAEDMYRQAQKRLPGEPGLHYDLGAALHRQAQALPAGPERDKVFEAAERELRLALDTPESKLRSSTHYNLGNNLFERKKYKEAVEEYKKSLKLDPLREDARRNLELALRQKDPPPPPDQQPQPNPDQQPQPKQDDQAQAPPQPSRGEQQQPPQPQPQPEAQNQEPKPGDEERPSRDLTEDDVERKLAELERRSKDLQVRRAAERAQERRRGKPAKDW